MNRKQHRFLDHPILAYFLLMIPTMILIAVFGKIDLFVARFIPGYAKEVTAFGRTVVSAEGIGNALGAIVSALIFTFWFRPEFKGFLGKKNLLNGLKMMLPVLLIHYIGSIVSCFMVGTSSVLLAFLKAFSPGFTEEVLFRGLGISNFMRVIKSEKQIKIIFWLTSVVFGLIHWINVFAGGEPMAVFVQGFYAIGMGMIFGAVFLRTGNLWSVMLAHTSVDFLEFVRKDIGNANGVMMGLGVGDMITVTAAMIAFVLALRLMSQKYYSQIMALWDEKWSRNTEMTKGAF